MKTAGVLIHESQFPENVRRDLVESLRARRINHKFHYDSVRQTEKWLALHQQFSPSRHDQNCQAIYAQAFRAAAARMKARRIHVIGLGCGGGQKDTVLLKLLKTGGKEIFYTPCDVSVAMVLTARGAALEVAPGKNCFPLVIDLASAKDLGQAIAANVPGRTSRLFTFFGMIPNFEPRDILPKLAAVVARDDLLLFSANLAPGRNYAAGMERILPQYDNPPTRDWLMTFLADIGIEKSDGSFGFRIETARNGLKRIAAWFHFQRRRTIKMGGDSFDFRPGEGVRLFFSYRYTPSRLERILAAHGLAIRKRWITASGEEGAFLCRRDWGTPQPAPAGPRR